MRTIPYCSLLVLSRKMMIFYYSIYIMHMLPSIYTYEYAGAVRVFFFISDFVIHSTTVNSKLPGTLLSTTSFIHILEFWEFVVPIATS